MIPSGYLQHGPTFKGWVPYICMITFHLLSSLVGQCALYACVVKFKLKYQH